MNQQKYWNRAAAEKEFTTPFHADLFSKYVKKEDTVLDVGCGYGRTLAELHGLSYQKLIGIDFSEAMIQRGRRQFPFLDLRIMENSRIDLSGQSIDAVILFAVLTCIPENEKQKSLLKEIKRVLKPGGILYVNDFLLNHDERNQKRYHEYEARYGVYGTFELPEGAILRHHDENWLRELLADFQQLEYSELTFTTMNGHQSRGFCYIGRIL